MPFQSGGQVLGEERLHLLAVGLGLGGVRRLHAREVTRRSFRRTATEIKRHEGRPRRRPTSGPSAPRPPGTTVGAVRGTRAARGGRARPGPRRRTASPKPSATEPATTASRRSSSAATDATRPADAAARRARSSPATPARGGRPVIAAIAGARRLAPRGSRGRRTTHGRPSGSTMTWPMWPALPSRAVEQPAVEHDAAADAGRHDHRRGSRARPRAAPRQPSPSASALASLSTHDRQAGALARARRRSGKSRHCGMLAARPSSPPGVIGPPQPTPHADRCAAVDRARSSTQPSSSAAKQPAIGVARRRSAARSRHSTSPSTLDQPRGQLRAADVDATSTSVL